MDKSVKRISIAWKTLIALFAFIFVFAAVSVLPACTEDTDPPPTEYTVTVSAAPHGTVTPSVTSAAAGTTVTLTVTPDTGYKLKSLKYNGTDITSAKSFTMPAENVTVTSEFEAVPPTPYAISVATVANGTVTPSVTSATAGTTITVTVTPNNGYKLSSLKYNDNDITSAKSFTMPNEAVTLTAVFVAETYTVTAGSCENGSVAVSSSSAAFGSTVTVTATPDGGYELVTVKVNGVAIGELEFVMPNENVTVTAEFTAIKYSVTVSPATNGTVSVDAATAAAGTTVTVTATPENGYGLKSLVYNDGTTDTAVTETAGVYSFTMPEGTVTVTAVFEQVYTISVDTIEHGTVSADKTVAFAGDTVNLTVVPEANYALKELKFNNEDVDISGTEYNFTMPAENVTLSARFNTAHTITASTDGNGTLTVAARAAEGVNISIKVTPNTGYELATLKWNDGIDHDIGISGVKAFTMPDCAVTVTATFKKTTYTVTISDTTNGTVTANKSTANYGDEITLTVTPATGYEIDELKMNGTAVEGNKFTMPAGNATVTATFKKTDYTVTVSDTTNGTVTAIKSTANYGDEITLTVTPATGYEIDELKMNGTAVTGNKFTMPAGNATVTATFKKTDYTVTVGVCVNGAISVDLTTAHYGDTVTVTQASAESGYILGTVSVDGVEIEGTTFTMPAKSVEVTAVFEKIGYTVTVDTAQNGTVSVNKTNTHIGETITVTVSASTGYELVSLKYNDGTTDTAITETAGVYSFTMPAASVTVTATFKKTDYTVTVSDTTNGTVTASKSTANYGDEITLTVTPATGYEIDELKMNGTAVTGNKFTMPASNATVTATFKKTTYTVTVSDTTNGTVTANKSTANYGDEITLTVTPATGYEIDELKMNGTAVTGNKFTMPASNATVTATFKKTDYTVTVSDTTNGTVTANKSTANYGDEITLTVTPATGYEIDELKMNGTAVEGNKFTMPAGNATVTATFKKTDYTVTVSDTTNGTVTANKSTANYGDEITLTVTPATGYEIDELKMNGTAVTGNKFTMPAASVTVTATFKKTTYTVTISDTTNGTVTANKSTANYGDEITLTVTPAAGYQIATVSYDDGEAHTLTAPYSFTMPACEVTVSATFTAITRTVTVGSVTNGTVTASAASGIIGDVITFTAEAATGYELDTLTANGTDIKSVKSFTIGEEDVTVAATFKLTEYSLSVETVGGGSISLNKGKATMGETVTLTVTPNSGYGATALKYSYGAPATDVYLYDGAMFTMPACDVSVSAVFKEIVHITDEAGFNAIANDLSGYYVLDNNIQFSGWCNMIGLAPLATSGGSWVYDKSGTAQEAAAFTGVLDGKGYIISNYKQGEGGSVNSIGTYYKGVFGYIGEGGMVGNVVLRNVSTMGSQKSGFIAGVNDGKIKNVTIEESCNPFVRYQGVGVYATALNNGTLENIVCYKATAGCAFGNPLKESVPMERASLDSGDDAKEINCYLLPTGNLSATLGDGWFYHAAVGTVSGNDTYMKLVVPDTFYIGEYNYFLLYQRSGVECDYIHIWNGGNGVGLYPNNYNADTATFRVSIANDAALVSGNTYTTGVRISGKYNSIPVKYIRRVSFENLTQYDNAWGTSDLKNSYLMYDGDLNTFSGFYYKTKVDNPLTYIQLDLQQNTEINSISLYMGKTGSTGDYMRDVIFAYSTDGTTFTDIDTPAFNLYVDLKLDAPVTARYIRAYTHTAPVNDVIVREFAVNRLIQSISLGAAFIPYADHADNNAYPNALDGCDGTYTWICPDGNFKGTEDEKIVARNILLTLSEETTVKSVSLKSTGDMFGENCTFYYSADNVSFTEITSDIAEITYNDGNYSITFNGDGVSASYVKVVCGPSTKNAYWFKIVDFSVNR